MSRFRNFQANAAAIRVSHQKLAIDFFSYPSEFVIQTQAEPTYSYQISITNGKTTNSVHWTDDVIAKPGYEKADKLRELQILINKIIQAHPEIQVLPAPKEFCM